MHVLAVFPNVQFCNDSVLIYSYLKPFMLKVKSPQKAFHSKKYHTKKDKLINSILKRR